MSRRKMGNPQKMSRFICCKCLTENKLGDGIQRIRQREKGHLKNLTCFKCNEITKNIEIRYCETFDEIIYKARKVHLNEYSKNDITIYQNIEISNLNNLNQDSIYFSPTKERNSLIENGMVLIEFKVPEVYIEKSEEKDDYIEYKLREEPEIEYITSIYIPEIFKSRISVPKNIYKQIKWCKIKAYCEYESGVYECSEDKLKRLGQTALLNSYESNYFKGKNKDKSKIELKNITYILKDI